MPDLPLRSVLFMPASNQRAMDKARDLPADALIFDLEEARRLLRIAGELPGG